MQAPEVPKNHVAPVVQGEWNVVSSVDVMGGEVKAAITYTDDDAIKIINAADNENMTVGDYIHTALMERAVPRTAVPPPPSGAAGLAKGAGTQRPFVGQRNGDWVVNQQGVWVLKKKRNKRGAGKVPFNVYGHISILMTLWFLVGVWATKVGQQGQDVAVPAIFLGLIAMSLLSLLYFFWMDEVVQNDE